MKNMLLVCFNILLFIQVKSQDDLNLNQQAIAIVKNSLKVIGGAAATDSLRIQFRAVNKKNTTPGQSFSANEKLDEYHSYYEFIIDRVKRNEKILIGQPMSGFNFISRVVSQNNKWWLISDDRNYYTEIPTSNSSVIFLFPQNILLNVLKTPDSLRLKPEVIINKQALSHISGFATGVRTDLYIDKKTGYLVKYSQITTNRTYGDETTTIVYEKFKAVSSLAFPTVIHRISDNKVTGTVDNKFAIEYMTPEPDFDKISGSIPSDYTKMDFSYRKKSDVRQISKNIFFIENASETPPFAPFSYNTAFAVFENFIFVLEAPWDEATSERVIKKIKEKYPSKPIKYVLLTHHHEDHLGGLRRYIAEGATILTSSSNQELVKKMATAPFTLNPDAQAKKNLKANIEPVKNLRTISDKENSVIIYELGATEHTREMLFAYFPDDKIVFQADLINYGEYPLNKTSNQFLAALKKLKIEPKTILGVHGKIVSEEIITSLFNK